jgi:hypothetical protein
MNIIDRGRQWYQQLRHLTQRTPWEQRQCPRCGGHDAWKHGTYTRHPYTRAGRQPVVVQRYRCRPCRRTFVPALAAVAPRRWYGREGQRLRSDSWHHLGTSLRRTAELVRSLGGRQERWWWWQPWATDPHPDRARWRLSASTVHRWLDGAGRTAQATTTAQLRAVPTRGQFGTDGLWAKLRGGTTRVVLALTDRVTGVVYPPVVVAGEDDPAAWAQLFHQAHHAGVPWRGLGGVTSDGARGLAMYLEQTLVWVNHQRCVFHLWRNLARPLAPAVATVTAGLHGAAATAKRRATGAPRLPRLHAVLDAEGDAAAVAALRVLAAHPLGAGLARALRTAVESVLVYQGPANRGLGRVGPEWLWRDFRLRLSHGRNHRSDERVARAALVGAVYRNATPTQCRRERKRTYRCPGRSPFQVAGMDLGPLSYLDMLTV